MCSMACSSLTCILMRSSAPSERRNQPKPALMKRFDLTDVQATAILDLRLCQLAKLEESKLKEEQAKVAAERNDLEKTLDSKARLKALIRKELIADAKRYGDPRRSPLAGGEDMAEAATFAESELIANEPITVTLSEKGWVRSAKGYDLDPANWPTAAATPSAMRPGAAATTFWLSWTLPAAPTTCRPPVCPPPAPRGSR